MLLLCVSPQDEIIATNIKTKVLHFCEEHRNRNCCFELLNCTKKLGKHGKKCGKSMKMHISTSVWSGQHLNIGQNIDQFMVLYSTIYSTI